eukprot:3055787-Pyramimonas_sp.AAC.1
MAEHSTGQTSGHQTRIQSSSAPRRDARRGRFSLSSYAPGERYANGGYLPSHSVERLTTDG